MFRHIGTDEPKTMPDREIEALLAKPVPDIQFLSAAEVAEAERTGEAPKGLVVVFLEDIMSDWERGRAERYEMYVVGWDRHGRPPLSDAKLRPVIDAVSREEGDDDPPSPRKRRGGVTFPWLVWLCCVWVMDDVRLPEFEVDDGEGARRHGRGSAQSGWVAFMTRGDRRRIWAVEQKRAIALASLDPGTTPTEVARRYGMTSGLLYTWRRPLRKGQLGSAPQPVAGFARVERVGEVSRLR